MATRRETGYVFDALVDFTQIKDPVAQLAEAREFGIRIIESKNLVRSDWKVVEGPFWSFRRRASSLLFGHDDKDRFFIRRLEATEGSNIRLYYYDLVTKRDAIIEFYRKPGLCLTLRSGRIPACRADVYSRCTHFYMLRFISINDCIDVL